MPEQSNDYRVVVFGAGGVGKSSLVLRFVRGTFRESYIPTIEDTYRQVISCNKQVCTLQITDTTGSHQFPAMQRLSISKGHAFILVYSITSRQSLEELKPIFEEIIQIKGDTESIPIMLVGNKCDETNREVALSEGAELAKRWNCAFLETSAKTNYNVKELFQELLQLEKRRTMSLQLETKKSKSQKRKEKLKGKCMLMWMCIVTLRYYWALTLSSFRKDGTNVLVQLIGFNHSVTRWNLIFQEHWNLQLPCCRLWNSIQHQLCYVKMTLQQYWCYLLALKMIPLRNVYKRMFERIPNIDITTDYSDPFWWTKAFPVYSRCASIPSFLKVPFFQYFRP